MPTTNAGNIIRGLIGVNLAAGFVLYLTYYRQLVGALAIIRNITPPLIFVAGMILAVSHDRTVIRRRRAHGEDSMTIVINYRDAMWHDAITFLTAIAIVVIPPLLSTRGLDLVDILQAGLAIAALSYLRSFYFGKIYH